jgi:hypothetical protein
MPKLYNTLEGSLSIGASTTASRTGADNSVAVVGGYDASKADSSVTEGEATLVTDPTGAEDLFGASELARMVEVVSANGVGEIYGVPVSETLGTTESFSSTSSETLSNAPLFNPDLHPEHSVTVTDTVASEDLTVNIVYDDTVSQPSESNTASVNPNSGDIEFDSSSDYDVTYDHGSYSNPVTNAADVGVRNLIVGTEAASVKTSIVSTLSDIAADFDFKRAFFGAKPEIDAADISSYVPDEQDWRVVEVAPALATMADGAVRTASAVGGFLSAQPIGPDGSGLFDQVGGLESLNTEYRSTEAKDFDGVTALTRNGRLATAQTTSDTEQFRLIYAAEIIDAVAQGLFSIARDYAGGPQDTAQLEVLLETQLVNYSSGSPPLLGFGDGRDANPFDVSVTFGDSNTIADAGVTFVPYPIAEEVNLSLTVSDGFVEFNGVSA